MNPNVATALIFYIHTKTTLISYNGFLSSLFSYLSAGIIHASDENPQALSSDMQADKVVLLEFRDHSHFKHFFSQSDYIEAAKIRDAASTISATVFERFEMPK